MKKNKLLFAPILAFALVALFDHGYARPLLLDETKPDSSQPKRNGMLCLPILFYQPETKLAGGAVVGYYFREAGSKITSRPSTVVASFAYTQKQQITATLAPDIYWRNETYHLTGSLEYLKFPDKFYGIGNKTSETDEENYTPRSASVLLGLQKKLRARLNLGIQYQFANTKILEVEPGGLLAQKNILGSAGVTVSGAGLLLNWDSRNNIFYPYFFSREEKINGRIDFTIGKGSSGFYINMLEAF